MDTLGEFVRARRTAAGLTQQGLATISSVRQSTIAAIERGRRQPSDEARQQLSAALLVRPRDILLRRRRDVVAAAAKRGLQDVKVFGSVARGDDTPYSDVDLMATYPADFDFLDKAELIADLERLLTVHVDLVSRSSTGAVAAEARHEAVAL
ncbi:nucleotidyltransferase domain-containing protein [Isoptericola aurantiacus]|uniref:nucleotidyltransferase domain-containing protein n=1 Tax=Isoptericola aurantiacus TaxID=3377839 RepID=UPI00383B4D46